MLNNELTIRKSLIIVFVSLTTFYFSSCGTNKESMVSTTAPTTNSDESTEKDNSAIGWNVFGKTLQFDQYSFPSVADVINHNGRIYALFKKSENKDVHLYEITDGEFKQLRSPARLKEINGMRPRFVKNAKQLTISYRGIKKHEDDKFSDYLGILSFDGENWKSEAQEIVSQSTNGIYSYSCFYDGDTYYFAWASGTTTEINKLINGKWEKLGELQAYGNTFITVDKTGTIYLASAARLVANDLKIFKYSNESWSDLPSPFPVKGQIRINGFEFNGDKLYLLCKDFSYDIRFVACAYENGAWEMLGEHGFSWQNEKTGEIETHLFFINDVPAVSYRRKNLTPIILNYKNSNWEPLGKPSFYPDKVMEITPYVVNNTPHILLNFKN